MCYMNPAAEASLGASLGRVGLNPFRETLCEAGRCIVAVQKRRRALGKRVRVLKKRGSVLKKVCLVRGTGGWPLLLRGGEGSSEPCGGPQLERKELGP